MFQVKLISFFDQLLDLFEDNNKVVYRRLICIRHGLRNEMVERDLTRLALSEYNKPHVQANVTRRNNKFLKNTPYSNDIDLLWEACSPENKLTIWKWVDMLVAILQNEDMD